MEFYTSVETIGRNIVYRGVKNGRKIRRKVPYEPTFYLKSNDPNEQFKTIFGEPLKPIKPGTIPECRDFLEQYSSVSNFQIYGNSRFKYSYISEITKDNPKWDFESISIAYLDIEVSSENGFPQPKHAREVVTAISLHIKDRTYTFALKDFIPDEKTKFFKCDTEEQLLKKFLEVWRIKYPDIVSGWNVRFFDIPYLVNRITKILGESEAAKLSPWNRVTMKEVVQKGRKAKQETFKILGVAILDYYDLYVTYPKPKSLESGKLEFVAMKELGKGKLDYSEYETLHELYVNNHQKYIEYNIHDARLVKELDDKCQLMRLALTLAYSNRVNYDDVFAQVTMWDSIIYHNFICQNIVVPEKKDAKSKSEQFKGAYVKPPLIGKHRWVVGFDLNSLYPHIMMQYNISPETLIESTNYNQMMWDIVRDKTNDIQKFLEKRVDTKFLKAYGATVTPNLQFFSTKQLGLIPKILDEVYQSRFVFREKEKALKMQLQEMKRAGAKASETESIEKEIIECYNMQQAAKVNLNSAYGAMGNLYFRFFDIRMAEAITYSGQLTIKWIMNSINLYLNNLLKTKDVDYVIASDTDSMYLNLSPIVDKFFQDQSDTKKIVKFLDKACKEKIQPQINKSFDDLADYLNAHSQRMVMKRESIADAAIWTKKKRYILSVYDEEGVTYDTPELKIVGLEPVKSSTPAPCRNRLKECIRIILSGTEPQLHDYIRNFRKEYETMDFYDIAIPKSVNEMSKWVDEQRVFKKGTPIHSKASLMFNRLLEKKKLTNKYPLIREGDKIRYIYMVDPNPLNNNTIAFISEIPKEFGLNNYIDRETQFNKTFIKPMQPILDIVKWNPKKKNTLNKFFKSSVS